MRIEYTHEGKVVATSDWAMRQWLWDAWKEYSAGKGADGVGAFLDGGMMDYIDREYTASDILCGNEGRSVNEVWDRLMEEYICVPYHRAKGAIYDILETDNDAGVVYREIEEDDEDELSDVRELAGTILRVGEVQGGETCPETGDSVQVRMPDGTVMVLYLSRSFGDAMPTDEEILDSVERVVPYPATRWEAERWR